MRGSSSTAMTSARRPAVETTARWRGSRRERSALARGRRADRPLAVSTRPALPRPAAPRGSPSARAVAAGFEEVGNPRLYEAIHHLRPLRPPGHLLLVELHERPNVLPWMTPPSPA